MVQPSLFSPEPQPRWSVTDLTRYLQELIESDYNLQDVWVRGEVSNVSRPASGHLYLTIKDANSSLRCVMWKPQAQRMRFLPRTGDAVDVHGRVGIYEAGGQYQLYADAIYQAGEGTLYQEFLRLKDKLEAEGLFDPERKRPIPERPRRIGIVTSPSGAALQDMLNTLRRRFPLVEVILVPTAVQGSEAPAGIVAALASLNQIAAPDLILLARGGGSIEDLWAFNDEHVVRAIVASQAAVISGVGHETDFTLADFAADLRAPTPTAAAELATPDQNELRQELSELRVALSRTLLERVNGLRAGLAQLRTDFQHYAPQKRILNDRQRLDDMAVRAATALSHRLALQRAHLSGSGRRLASLNPLSVLGRGFALVTHEAGYIVRSVEQASPGDQLHVRVNDGVFDARVESAEKDTR